MDLPSPQVPSGHYRKPTYLTHERWESYWYQLKSVMDCRPRHVLEIGVGNGIVRDTLRSFGYEVKTADIDPELKPDHVASVTSLPFPDSSFDTVLCAEVLEHLPWEQSLVAMKEIARVTGERAVITLPHSGFVFSFISKIPLLPWIRSGFKIPHFWKTHQFKGQHYWEIGKKTWSIRRVADALESSGLRVLSRRINPDDPAHVVFICAKA